MGVDAQADGAGSSSIAVLDAATGEVVTSLVNNRRTQAFVAPEGVERVRPGGDDGRPGRRRGGSCS